MPVGKNSQHYPYYQTLTLCDLYLYVHYASCLCLFLFQHGASEYVDDIKCAHECDNAAAVLVHHVPTLKICFPCPATLCGKGFALVY